MSLLKKREAEIQITKEQLEELEQELEQKEQKEQEQNEEIKEIKEELLTERRILKPVLFDSSSSSLSHSDSSNTPNNTPNKSSSSSSSFASSTSNPFAALASNTSFGFSAYKTNPFAAMGPPISQTSPTSPKPNPFSSLNPAPNPFMSYDSSKGLDYWNKIPKPTTSNQINEPTKLFAPPPLFVQTSKESNNSNGNSNNENDDDNDNDETGETNNDEQGIQDNNNNNDDLDSTGPFSPSHNIANGESDEECILQLRTKLFRFSRNGNKTEWIEIGIGPLRILQPSTKVLTEENLEVSNESNVFKHSRLVMRRENTIRGVGTKLLLNVLLSSSVTIGRQAEKAIRFTCFSESSPSTSTTTTSSSLSTEAVGSNSTSETVITPQLVPTSYLFKTEAIEDADKLLSSLESQISRAKNSSTLSTSSTLSKTETTSSTSLNEVNNQTFESQQNNDNDNNNSNNSSTENNSLKE
mmetsp:Transcript_12088/g.12452  ORF Transcript_12088/g.12452 Transcript_12088/m.12452 type:complete len:468 (-) Transcript_12088:406-1809(-)